MTSDWDRYAGFHRTSAEETEQESLKEFLDGRMKTSRLIWKASHYIIIIIAAEGFLRQSSKEKLLVLMPSWNSTDQTNAFEGLGDDEDE